MAESKGRISIYRHPVLVRVTHWINVVCLALLLMSGLQIFNAHPALYWGNKSIFAQPFFALTGELGDDGTGHGYTSLLGHRIDTTGLLGASADPYGELEPRGFPAWATIPSYQDLAGGRRWHFFFAWLLVLNGAAYLAQGFATGRFRLDLVPSRRDLGLLWHTFVEHLRFRFPKGDEAKHYNPLQKLSYALVVFVLLPLLILAGLTLSPQIDTDFPFLLSLFGGRQSARTIHFICAGLLLGFVIVHLAMVLVSGVWNNLRSMITGRYVIKEDDDAASR
jgi:thiosulfate reductase cytochrome b subunit